MMLKTCDICKTQFEDTLAACPRNHQPVAQDATDPLIGTIINDRYQLTQSIGKGAMGAVYKATQLTDGSLVAIKVLHTHLSSDPESIKRFQAEAKAASSLMHPHIVRLYEVGVIPGVGQPYIAMEFVEGKTLSELLREKRFFNTWEALPIIRQVCEALAEAHSNGVLHRDIKPANIMLMNRFGQENFVVVLDFSIAKVIQKVSDVDATTPGLILGSPAYMSPERFMGKGGDFRSEIYSMGIIMFQLLAGKAPFKANDIFGLMNEHVSAKPPRVKDVRVDADVPDSLEATIARALEKKPEDRHPNMKQLLSEINLVYEQLKANSATHQTIARPEENSPYRRAEIENSGMRAGLTTEANGGGQNVFDVDPGYTPNVAPTMGVSGFNSTQARKALGMDQPAPQQTKLTGELSQSGRLDKSLITRGNNNEQRKKISRDLGRPRLSPQLIALVVVVLVGIGVMATRLFAPPDNHTRVVQLIKSHNLDGAAALLDTWGTATHQGADQEAYGDALMQLGHAFEQEHNWARAISCYAKVPPGTKSESDALNQLKKLAKNKSEQ